MARARLIDMMQAYPFWVFDASGFVGNAALFTVFDPVFGFSSVSAPEITIEPHTVQPGNWEYKRRSVKTADVGPITLSRGTRFYDSDFYNWLTNAIRGQQPIRRNLVLVHFLGWRSQSGSIGPEAELAAIASLEARISGRAWMLYDCLPIRYKAGSDFDGGSSDVSIQELEVQPEHIIELTMATLSPVAARALSATLEVVSAVG